MEKVKLSTIEYGMRSNVVGREKAHAAQHS